MKNYKEIIEFIRGLYNEPKEFIPLHAPAFNGNEKEYLLECIDSTFVSSVGKFVDQFEEDIAKYTGANYAVACVNGTSALHIALKLVGVVQNTEVLTQPLTFIATANAIKYCNADPVFIDVDLDTLGLSPEKLENWLKNNTKFNISTKSAINKITGRKITACVPMHTFGHPCKIDEIVEICNKYNIPVVEDAAESLGSTYKGKHTGTFGKVGVLSFNGNKIITTGGGGMLLFNDTELAKKAKHLTTQAKVTHLWEFIHDDIGYNYRMPNINAALGVAQLQNLPAYLQSKRNIAVEYKNYFSSQATAIKFITEPLKSESNCWLNTLSLQNRSERDSFLKITNENGIMTRPVWNLMNKLTMFKDCLHGDLSNSLSLEESLVNIPSSVNISKSE